ncbi:MAG: diaminopimelate decarboxylase [Oscillospiraceae bacterium]|nr:diaminopimelate decarboxylase [Oscillospiraceae bacterium]
MFLYDCYGINDNGNLTIDGVDTAMLAQKYSTPLYVMSESLIRENIRSYKNAIERFYNSNGLVCYASKAFSCKEIYRICKDEGIGIDVVSGGELYTALSVDFDTDKICFHGNSKSIAEITLAIDSGVGRIVADNLTELENIDRIALEKGVTANVMLRVKPGIDAHTHDFIKTGKIDSKFGFALPNGEAFEAVKFCLEHNNIKLVGLHCHIGSQIFDSQPFELAAEVMVQFIKKISDELSYDIKELNLGGGFGIKYTQNDDPKPYVEYMEGVSRALIAECEKLSVATPYIIVEPGRSIVGAAGITLYSVSAVKSIPDICNYVLVDGGMCDNPRYALYQSEYEACVANKAAQEKTEKVTIAGKCCEGGDKIGENMPLQKAESGDIIAVFSTGAYNYSMSSNYNRNPRPAVVMISSNGLDKVIVKGETYEDLIRNDI